MIRVDLDSARFRWIALIAALLPAVVVLLLLLYNVTLLSEGIRRGEYSREVIIDRQAQIMNNQKQIIAKLDTILAKGDTLP